MNFLRGGDEVMCEYCNDIKNSRNDFAGCEGIYYNENSKSFKLVIEHYMNEINEVEIKYCPFCGKALAKKGN
jgi:hypothetical protein